jgi:hypothetical protein
VAAEGPEAVKAVLGAMAVALLGRTGCLRYLGAGLAGEGVAGLQEKTCFLTGDLSRSRGGLLFPSSGRDCTAPFPYPRKGQMRDRENYLVGAQGAWGVVDQAEEEGMGPLEQERKAAEE